MLCCAQSGEGLKIAQAKIYFGFDVDHCDDLALRLHALSLSRYVVANY